MANPSITALPEAPQRRMARDVYPVVADKWAAALGPWTTQVNDVVTWMGKQVDAVAASVKSASDSATAAGQAVTDAQAQVKLATDQAVASKGSADAAAGSLASVKVVAQAVDAAAGLPPAGPVGSVLRVKNAQGEKEFGVLVLSQVGDTLVSTQAPDSSWVPTGRIYSQATYPSLFSKLGTIADWLPSQQLSGNIPNNYTYRDIAYGNGLFVALDYSGNAIAITSPDGVTWTTRNLPSAAAWQAVEYGTNFVAVSTGTNNAAVTSPDGVTWTLRSLPSSNSWTALKFNNGTYLTAVGGNTVAATSTDAGATWQARTLPATMTIGYYSLAAGAGLFVYLVSNTTSYYTSANGISWTSRTLPFIPSGVIYANGVFMAWGQSGTFCATSPDGITWTQYALPMTGSSNYFSIAGGGGQFLLRTQSLTTYYTSVDGSKWTARPGPQLDTSSAKMAYGNKSFVSIDDNANSVRRIRKPWSYDTASQFFTTDPVIPSQGLNQYIKAI